MKLTSKTETGGKKKRNDNGTKRHGRGNQGEKSGDSGDEDRTIKGDNVGDSDE